MAKIVIPYKPRAAFEAYHRNAKRFSVVVAHRRAGKTVARINKLIAEAVTCQKENPRFGYVAPYYVQAKEIAWQYLKHYTAPLEPLGRKVNEGELSITLGTNNATIRLYGAESAERIRGLYFDGISMDEAQDTSGATLRTIILPALSDRQGWLDVSGTSKGWANLLGETYRLALDNPDDWYCEILRASDTGILPESELAMMRKLMLPNEYEQEYECSFDAAITGSVYGEWMAKAAQEGRIKSGIYDATLPVHTAWDLGYDDATAIWFWQRAGNEVRWIDFYESFGKDIAHYCEVLTQRGYRYGEHYVPHDAANKLLAAGGRSIVQQAWEMGVKMKVVAATSQQNGISAMRKILETSWFDRDKTKRGIECLKEYQFAFDKHRKTYSSTPRHDDTSHAADAAEIVGQVLRPEVVNAIIPAAKTLETMTAHDLFWGDTASDSFVTRI